MKKRGPGAPKGHKKHGGRKKGTRNKKTVQTKKEKLAFEKSLRRISEKKTDELIRLLQYKTTDEAQKQEELRDENIPTLFDD